MNIGEKFYCSKCMREIEIEGICPFCGHDHSKENDTKLLEEGTLLHNRRYQIGSGIGAGGFGITYAAWDMVLNQPVAIKEYFPLNLCDRDSREDYRVIPDPDHKGLYEVSLLRFIREARILGTLQNVKNVVPVLEWFEENNTAYIVMKFIRGENLEDYVKKYNIDPQALIRMMRDLIDSLILVHAKGIIHRDISPSNIMVQEDGSLVLIDFGAAVSEERRAQGQDHTVIFNRSYAPVEQYDEEGLQGPWTDIYALSATIYALICGEPPVESAARVSKDTLKSPKERGIRLKKWQNKAIMDGLVVQPDKRTQTMEIFRSSLYHLPMPEEVQRQKRLLTAAIIVTALIAVFSILLTINFTYGFVLGDGIRYSLIRDGWHVKGYTHEQEQLTIPEKILGTDVVQIDEGAFQGSKQLSNVLIPGTINTVSEFAFNNCENLVNVKLNEGVKKLSSQAFSNCTGLQSVFVPDSVEAFDQDTFTNSDDRLVLIGNTGTQAAEIAKENDLSYAYIETCDNETGVTITSYVSDQTKAKLPDYIDGKMVTEIGNDEEKTVFFEEMESVILPRYLQKIGDYAFLGTKIKEIDLPNLLQSIGYRAFSQSYLTSIKLPESVVYVGEAAFSPCVNLKEAELSPNIGKIPQSCFEGSLNLESVTIPKGIDKIEMLAFARCQNLSSIRIPEGVQIVEDYAFLDCYSLENIHLPASLKQMGPKALNGCPNSIIISSFENTYTQAFCEKNDYTFYNMSQFDRNFEVNTNYSLRLQNEIKADKEIILPSLLYEKIIKRVYDLNHLNCPHVVLPEFIESIAFRTFYRNNYIQSVICPDTLQIIDTWAFSECKNLQRIDIKEGLSEIARGAFWSCESLENITLPSTLEFLGDGAFEYCKNLKSITIPPSMNFLDTDVFAETGLTTVTIPGNISKARTSFYGCRDLKEAIVEEGVRTLWGTFAECESLESVIIPSTMNQISRSTFMNCRNLRDIWIYSDTVDLDYEWVGVHHHTDNGLSADEQIRLETDNPVPLFGDSPDLTIHAYSGSTAHKYAIEHGINFEALPNDGEHELRVIENDFSDEVTKSLLSEQYLIRVLTPKSSQPINEYFNQFRFALGYGLDEIAYQNLEACEKYEGDDIKTGYYKILAHKARIFQEQATEHGFENGAGIGSIAENQEHPSLHIGDIIVEIDGEKVSGPDDIIQHKQTHKEGPWEFTVLRENKDGKLEKITVTVSASDPLTGCVPIGPDTFE